MIELPNLAPKLERSEVMDTFENLMEAIEPLPFTKCEQNFAQYFRDFTDHTWTTQSSWLRISDLGLPWWHSG